MKKIGKVSKLKEFFLKLLRRFINSFGEKKLYDEETERDEIKRGLQDRLTLIDKLINDQKNKAVPSTYKENLEE